MEQARVISAEFLNDGSGKKHVVIMGKSGMTKPVNEIYAQGSVYIETDTGDSYWYDEDASEWVKG